MEYNKKASQSSIDTTVKNLRERGITAELVQNREAALEKIKSLIPKGVSVMNGSSMTLEQIGYIEYLKSAKHGWNNLHENIINEKDPVQQAVLRKQSVLSDYYLGSVHAFSEDGEMVIASATGSQLPHLVFTSANLILVAGVQKITPNLENALKRLEEYVFPLEDKRMKENYGPESGSMLSKVLIFNKEHPMMKRNVHVILVNEILGF